MITDKSDYISYRIEKSKETFNDALILAENKSWNSCMNRLYYSSFYLVNALLYKHNIQATTHNGIRTQFFAHFIKTEILLKEDGKLFSNLFAWRQESDYMDFMDFEEEFTLSIIEEVKQLNEKIQELI